MNNNKCIDYMINQYYSIILQNKTKKKQKQPTKQINN